MSTTCWCAAVATAAGIAVAQSSVETRADLVARLGLVARPSQIAAPPAPLVASLVRTAEPAGKGRSFVIAPDDAGQYHTELEVEGRLVQAMVDTGAGFVSLSNEAARQLGFDPAPGDYRLAMNTANGVAYAAAIEIPEVHVGPLVGRNVKAIVMQPGALTTPALLGMSFLQGLSGFAVVGGRMVLTQ